MKEDEYAQDRRSKDLDSGNETVFLDRGIELQQLQYVFEMYDCLARTPLIYLLRRRKIASVKISIQKYRLESEKVTLAKLMEALHNMYRRWRHILETKLSWYLDLTSSGENGDLPEADTEVIDENTFLGMPSQLNEKDPELVEDERLHRYLPILSSISV